MQRRRLMWAPLAAPLLWGCAARSFEVSHKPPEGQPLRLVPDTAPAAPREFRAAWVASVAHIDWPTHPGLDAAAQQAQALAILERALELGLNAVVLQIRPAADALYPSALEPWSEVLSGQQGLAPQPPYDPLAFWIEQSHARGLALHAWFNPFRARHSTARSPLASSHIAQRRPDLVRRYGDQLWLDPAEAQAAEHGLSVIRDVVSRYDLDGVHIDDYFYPYPLQQAGADVPFPDDEPWQRYVLDGGDLPRDAWRRRHVDRFVQALYRTVKSIKPHVRVGISPFGIGRPDRRPAGITGFSQYDRLYADVEHWLASGWLDYLAPQLYWPLAQREQAFEVLLAYWQQQNPLARAVWPGLFTSRLLSGAPAWSAQEIVDQIAAVRQRGAGGGQLHFSMVALMKDAQGVATALRQGPYAQPALPPVMPWLAPPARPSAPAVRRQGDVLVVSDTSAASAAPAFWWSLWWQGEGQWHFVVHPAGRTAWRPPAGCRQIVAAAVDRHAQESPRVALAWTA